MSSSAWAAALERLKRIEAPDDLAEIYEGLDLPGLRVDRLADEDGEAPDFVLLEGKPLALELFAARLLAHAYFGPTCGLQSYPGTAGLSAESKLGIYVHSIPCVNYPGDVGCAPGGDPPG